jgi:hypothetical protein
MTRLFVNNEEIALPPPSLSSLRQVISHVEENLLPPDSVIREVNLDGYTVDAGNFENNPEILLGDLTSRERIEITTCTLRDIARDSIREAEAYLLRVEGITPSIAAAFRDYPGPEAFENLKQLYDGFYWMSLLLRRIESVFAIDPSDTKIAGISLQDHHQKFIIILKQLVESQEQGDFALVADLLEFEALPMVPVWKTLFADVSRETAANK